MRFGTYMIIGSVFAGVMFGGYIRERHAKCPAEVFELDWTMVQLAVTWPGVLALAVTMPSGLPKTPCKEK